MSQPAKCSPYSLTRGATNPSCWAVSLVPFASWSLSFSKVCLERPARHAAFCRIGLLLPFRCIYLVRASSWASDLVHIGDHRLHPHFAHWRVGRLVNKDRRSHLRGASGVFRIVVKIDQNHFHRRAQGRTPRNLEVDRNLELGWRHSRPATLAASLRGTLSARTH
jgi:hypothetical protein